jgi:hypothetical protein
VKCHRLETKDSFAGTIHRCNLFLEPARRTHRAELAVGVCDDIYGVGNSRCHTANAGDKGSCLKFAAETNRIRLERDARVTDVDVVIAIAFETAAGKSTQRCVVAARGITEESVPADGRVGVAFCVVIERI